MKELILQIFEVCIIPLLGLLTGFLVDYLKVKKQEIKTKIKNETAQKYNDMIWDTVSKCVIATNQTYVDSLKKSGDFNVDAQKEAFKKTLDSVLEILADDAKIYIEETTGDINTYLITQIEAAVKAEKGALN